MTTDRAKQVISCYGGRSEQWPDDERLTIQNLIKTDTKLLSFQQQALNLDEKLEQLFNTFEIIETKQLVQKILLNLPAREIITHSQIVSNKNALCISSQNNTLLNFFFNPARAIIAVALLLLFTVSLVQFNQNYQAPVQILTSTEDELLLMTEALDNSYELEWLAILEPELLDDLDML